MTKKNKVIRTIAAVTAVALLGGGIYLLVKNDVAQKINWQDILIYAPTPMARETLDEAVNNSSDKPSADRVPEYTKKELTAQVRQLSNEHSDSVAWLYIPDTNIDYPIMQSGDNDYYTRRAADGSYLYAGSLFMDYRCSSDFSDFNSVIYGHNMGNGTMFADIPNYENEEFFMNHSFGWLTTDDNLRLIDFFAVARTVDTSGLYLADPTFEKWDLQLRNCASIYKEIGISADDHLITLSTCTSAEGNSRTVLIGKIIEESDVE
ncbi:class B sortase [Ruminococcus bicirculans (ex Wegman et al. 2014)]|uniref:class B sortase n=1 Tax=Ruminococcus bicirculans (ex Wegman et al. 2014) TaxID=1160721 RepID=UPI00307D649F